MIKRIQETELGILRDLNRVCKNNNIEYFLAQGTLLGAAKYQGFIPWDDDVDVMISFGDLNRLIKAYQREGNKEYMITNCFVEKHYPLPWTKIRAVNTLSRPVRYKELPINWGICIDIFPFYPMSDFKIIRKIEYILYKTAAKMLMAELTKYEENHGAAVRILEKIPISVRHGVLRLAEKNMSRHKDGKYILIGCKGTKILERSMILGKEKYLSFENENFRVPSEYHEYLTLNYGDYMAPLPKEKQMGHEDRMGQIEWKI